MKKVMISVLLWAVMAAVMAVQAGNMLSNQSFEAAIGGSDWGNWFAWGGAVVSSDRAYDGALALKIQDASSGMDYAGFEQKIPVVAGREYRASFNFSWTAPFFGGVRLFEIDWRDSGDSVIRTDSFMFGLEGPDDIWYFSGYYPVKTPANATSAEVRFKLESIQSGGALYMDDITFEEDPERVRVLRNIGFEQAFGDSNDGNWATWGSATQLSYQAYSDSYSLCLQGGASAGVYYGGAAQRIDADSGEDYTASFYFYADADYWVADPLAQFEWFDAAGASISTNSFSIDLSGGAASWQFSGDYALTAPANACRVEFRFNFSDIGHSGNFYIDDVRFGKPCDYFRCESTNILDGSGEIFLPHGLVLSGWLFPEGYFWGLPDGEHLDSATCIQNRILEILGGHDAAKPFWDHYYNTFLQASDIEEMATVGCNMVRLPFNYRDLSPENNPGAYTLEHFEWWDRCIDWCRSNDIYVILDMHCSPGGAAEKESGDPEYTYPQLCTNAQGDVYTKELGIACLWNSNETYHARTGRTPAFNQQRTAEIWQRIAERYKDEAQVIGYEIVNEPMLATDDPEAPNPDKRLHRTELVPAMREALINITRAVRDIDNRHIIFVQSDWFGNSIDGLTPPWDDNMCITVHRYWQTFEWNTWFSIQDYFDTRTAHDIPFWLGETGENSTPWMHRQDRLFMTNNIGTCWWGWKKMSHNAAAYAARPGEGYNYFRDNFWTETFDTNYALYALTLLADSLATTNCVYYPDFYSALFDTQSLFNIQPVPYTHHTVPGCIHFADYDYGNQGVAYADSVYYSYYENLTNYIANQGGAYRNDGVDLGTTAEGNGYKVNWTETGEWIRYTVSVLYPGAYHAHLRYTSGMNTQLRLLLNETTPLTGAVALPSSGGWSDSDWTTCILSNLTFPAAGIHTVKVEIIEGGMDLSHMDIVFSTNTYTDADGDAMDDHWEFQFRTNLLRDADDDGDGLSNFGEYCADTDPTSATSKLICALQPLTADEYRFGAPTSPNRVYTFQYSTNLSGTHWVDMQTDIPGNGDTLSMTVTNETWSHRYYRIRAALP
ncbi:MAG: carbohydrate-binding protein [Spartobacteria bacterium]|nr:carbohydrate-binding protein [Spartobacteria bacterium]